MRQTTPIEKILKNKTPIEYIIKTQLEQQELLDKLQLQQLQNKYLCQGTTCSPHGIGYPTERSWPAQFKVPAAETNSTCSTCTMKMSWMQKILFLLTGVIFGIILTLILKKIKR